MEEQDDSYSPTEVEKRRERKKERRQEGEWDSCERGLVEPSVALTDKPG